MRLRPLLSLMALTALGACGSAVPAGGLDATNASRDASPYLPPDATVITEVDSGCPHLATWEVYDSVQSCLRLSGIARCGAGPGPPRMLCSIGPDGQEYLSGEGLLVPGGHGCSFTEETAVDGASQCEDVADAGAARPDAGTPCPGGCDDGNPCTEDFCDLTGVCQHYTLADGTNCADKSACIGGKCHTRDACDDQCDGTTPVCGATTATCQCNISSCPSGQMCSRGVCIAASEAPCFAIDPAHDNAQPDDVVASPLKPTWIAQLEGPVYIPIVAGGRVFVATAAQASVRALDLATGQVLWGPIATAQSAMLAYDQGAVVALQGNGHIEGFDAVTGRSLWRTHRSPSGRNQREA